jgi:hypothetical protein
VQTIAKRYHLLTVYFVQVNGSRHKNSANRKQFGQLKILYHHDFVTQSWLALAQRMA